MLSRSAAVTRVLQHVGEYHARTGKDETARRKASALHRLSFSGRQYSGRVSCPSPT